MALPMMPESRWDGGGQPLWKGATTEGDWLHIGEQIETDQVSKYTMGTKLTAIREESYKCG